MPDQRDEPRTVAADHFVILVYPFIHRYSGAERSQLAEQLGGSWRPWRSRLDAAQAEAAAEDSLFFLPYVRELLFPELCPKPRKSAAGSPPPCPDAEGAAELSLDDLAATSPEAVIRLTLAPKRLARVYALGVDLPPAGGGAAAAPAPANLRIDWIDAVLFPQRMGFLALRTKLDEDRPEIARIRSVMSGIRLVQPPRVGWRMAALRRPGAAGDAVPMQDLVDELLEGMAATDDEDGSGRGRPGQEPRRAAPPARYSQTTSGKVYGGVFNLYSFAVLDDSHGPRTGGGADDDAPAAGSGLFDSTARRVVYELATCSDPTHPDFTPAPAHVRHIVEHNGFAHWDNWQGMALHDNVAVVGTRVSPFTLGTLSYNVENNYFPLYLLALFQKNRMSLMFGEIVGRDPRLGPNLERARQVWDSFLRFQEHYWFGEVTRRPQGTELYHLFQRGLGVPEQHRQLSTHVREHREYFEKKFEGRLDRLLKFVTFFAFPTSWMMTLYGKAFMPSTSWLWIDMLITATILYGGFLGAWFAWVNWMRE